VKGEEESVYNEGEVNELKAKVVVNVNVTPLSSPSLLLSPLPSPYNDD
jgi:hypothetical protein